MTATIEQYDIPILLIVFNRTDTLQVTFNAIKAQKPKFLFIAGDAARLNIASEAEKVSAARAIVQQIDWDCEVKTYFRETNSGSPAIAVTEFISWFFHQVEYGIIFEHDCVPHSDYFVFCRECLLKYRNDDRVSAINGVNFQDGQHRGNASYYFSATGTSTWGMATWRRFWKHYDVTLQNYPFENMKKDADFYGFSWKERILRNDRYRLLKSRKTNDWTYQTGFASNKIHGLFLVANTNLISNIGGGAEALNFKDHNNWRLYRKTYSILPIVHSYCVQRDLDADHYQCHRVTFRPTIVLPLLHKSVEVNLNSLPVALLFFAWRWFRRVFLEKQKY